MSLTERIAADLKQAMKDRNETARDALRMVKSELTSREIELGHALEEADETVVLQRAVKSRQDSAVQYDEGGRAELADKERAEIAIIERYLPKQMSEDDARAAVRAVVEELGASSKKDMGRVMKAVMDRHRGLIDGRLASKLAGELLG